MISSEHLIQYDGTETVAVEHRDNSGSVTTEKVTREFAPYQVTRVRQTANAAAARRQADAWGRLAAVLEAAEAVSA